MKIVRSPTDFVYMLDKSNSDTSSTQSRECDIDFGFVENGTSRYNFHQNLRTGEFDDLFWLARSLVYLR